MKKEKLTNLHPLFQIGSYLLDTFHGVFQQYMLLDFAH